MDKTRLILLIIFFIFLACGGKGKKQGLVEEVKTEEANLATVYEAEEILDTIIPAPGVKYKEKRSIDPNNPPIRLSLANSNKEDKNLDVADYYTKVKYVKLKHPLPPDKGAFLGDARVRTYSGHSSTSSRGVNSMVYVTKDKIVAGDGYFGYHCYDWDGKFEYTIASMDKLPNYRPKDRTVEINWDEWDDSSRRIGSISFLEDNCIFYVIQNKKWKSYFHNMKTRKNYLERPAVGGEPYLLNPTTVVSYFYSVHDENDRGFLASLDYKGDMLCFFMNHNPVVKRQNKASPSPDSRFMYYCNDQLTVRQAYNDTIYRVVSEKQLLPVYTMDFGSQKMDGEIALYGDKSEKMVPYTWIETSDFVFVMHTKDYDCPSNRESGAVVFNYTYYDKASKKLYNIPSHKLPEEYLISNSIEGGIPLIGNNIKANGKLLYIGYTKYQLESIINQKDFSSLTQEQQEKIKSLDNDLGDGEMLVMILE
ncbi:MAG: DUF4933 domain-containing protein [Prevotella sp.]|jgi:hypothetical protein|nr:DUF4933 domain-containing protein [Prevotella sp.]